MELPVHPGRGPDWEPAAQKGHLDRLLFEKEKAFRVDTPSPTHLLSVKSSLRTRSSYTSLVWFSYKSSIYTIWSISCLENVMTLLSGLRS